MILNFKCYSETNRDFNEVYFMKRGFRGCVFGDPMIVRGVTISDSEKNLSVIKEALSQIQNSKIIRNQAGSFKIEIPEITKGKGNNMINIRADRIGILQSIIDKLKFVEHDDSFSDEKILKMLLKRRYYNTKKTKSIMWEFVPEDDPRRLRKVEEEKKVKQYKAIVEELDQQIKVKEIEILLFAGVNELNEIYNEFYDEIESEGTH